MEDLEEEYGVDQNLIHENWISQQQGKNAGTNDKREELSLHDNEIQNQFLDLATDINNGKIEYNSKPCSAHTTIRVRR